MAIGKFLLKGEKLYGDIYTNHQPVTYIMSAVIQKAIHPNSIPLIVKRFRESVILWSFIFSFILMLRFGPWVLLFIIPFEMTKNIMLGQVFLAESFVVYPAVYLAGLVLLPHQNLGEKDLFFAGVLLAFIAFSLLPLLPFVAFVILALTLKLHRGKRAKMMLCLSGFLIVLVIVSYFSSLGNYFRDTFIANYFYYLPSVGIVGETANPLAGILAPVHYLPAFFDLSLFSRLLALNSLVYLFCILILFASGTVLLPFSMIFLAGFANVRSVDLVKEFFNGFHVLPWYGLMLFLISFAVVKIKDIKINRPVRSIFFLLVMFVFFLNSYLAKDYFLSRVNREGDAYINYSKQFDDAEAVRIMNSGNDTLFAAYDGSLIYWYSGVRHASPAVFYYPWMRDLPYLKSQVDEMFTKSPPAFLYLSYVQKDLWPYLDIYERLRKDEHETNLYVLKEKVAALTKEQYKGLDYYRFSF
ncbi:hypothetical protein M1271_01315 [Patescibacteria group bacterium]|nr:hypothetical protein [Patescibacteria group bacterium]